MFSPDTAIDKYVLVQVQIRDEIVYSVTWQCVSQKINREYVYSAVVYQKYLTRLRELIIFEPWRENYHFSQGS